MVGFTVKSLPLSLGFVLALALPGAADEVSLRNGAVFSGVVREQGDRVVIVMDSGSMSFLRIDVREIVRSDDPLKEYEKRSRTATDAGSSYNLALWARERGLAARSQEQLRKVIELDPGHEAARKLLGFEKVGERWLEGDELRIALGLIRHNGRWLPRETVERYKEQEKELIIESDRRATEEKIASMRRELDLARVALDRERLEFEKQRDQPWSWWGAAPLTQAPCPGYRSSPTSGPLRITSSYSTMTPPTQVRPPAGTLKP